MIQSTNQKVKKQNSLKYNIPWKKIKKIIKYIYSKKIKNQKMQNKNFQNNKNR